MGAHSGSGKGLSGIPLPSISGGCCAGQWPFTGGAGGTRVASEGGGRGGGERGVQRRWSGEFANHCPNRKPTTFQNSGLITGSETSGQAKQEESQQ